MPPQVTNYPGTILCIRRIYIKWNFVNWQINLLGYYVLLMIRFNN
uniref:Uncharacterized protein n=1 Tax=Anguilla anguilla TaxID=7936 RepID=A0A0E9T1E0_ANGAN